MLNVVALMGRLTADPEIKYTQSNTPVCSFTLAVERNYARQGEQRETDFIDVVAWRNTAEFVGKYFSKGQLVAVNGSLQTRSYEDRNGNRRKAVEVVADNVHFAEPKREPATIQYQPPITGTQYIPQQYQQAGTGFEPVESDLPF